MDLRCQVPEDAKSAGGAGHGLEEALKQWHEGVGVRLQRHMVSRLQRLQGAEISIGTACSGSDMLLKVVEALRRHWSEEFGVTLSFRADFACERDVKKQAFLTSQFGASCIFQDVSELSCPRARDVVSGKERRVPAVDMFASGFSCVSRSKLNANRKKNLHCVQAQQGETGATYAGTVGYIRTYSPEMIILENVVDLMQDRAQPCNREKSGFLKHEHNLPQSCPTYEGQKYLQRCVHGDLLPLLVMSDLVLEMRAVTCLWLFRVMFVA